MGQVRMAVRVLSHLCRPTNKDGIACVELSLCLLKSTDYSFSRFEESFWASIGSPKLVFNGFVVQFFA